MNKRKLYIIFTIIIVALLPSAVFASVIIDQSYGVSTSTPPNWNPVEMTQGPNYTTAHSLGFTTLTNGSSPTTNSITFGYVGNDTYVELVNVLEIKNNSDVKATTLIDLEMSNDTHIAVYYSSTPATAVFPSSTAPTSGLGTKVGTTPTTLVIGTDTTSTASTWYISVVITGTVSSATLTMNYDIK